MEGSSRPPLAIPTVLEVGMLATISSRTLPAASDAATAKYRTASSPSRRWRMIQDTRILLWYVHQQFKWSLLTVQPWQNDAPALTEREALETELIRRLISSYFNIVRESIADQVPKAIMHLLVNHSKDVVQNRLVSELYKDGLFEELLYEDDGIKAEREKCEKLLRTYKEAAKIVGEVL
jgi:hypothetical protein